jgi:dynein heavy chain
LKRLWVHEVLRVYADRLVDEVDTIWLIDNIRKVLSNRMEENLNELFADLAIESNLMVSIRNI